MERWLIFVCFISTYVAADSCETDIRLTPTASLATPANNVGRLEVCVDGVWGTIALAFSLDFWSEKNIQVACRQLNFSGGLNSIPPSHIPAEDRSTDLAVHYSRVTCYGQEQTLSDCPLSRVDNGGSSHNKDVFIVCRPKEGDYSEVHIVGPQLGDVRLFGDVESGRGAIEMFTSLGWTGICPDDWSNTNARIICQNLGYRAGATSTYEVENTNVSRLVYSSVCSETFLSSSGSLRVGGGKCSFLQVTGPEDCAAGNTSYAGVDCEVGLPAGDEARIRLFGQGRFDSTRALGVVELFEEDRWGMLCDREPEDVSRTNAQILCSHLFVGHKVEGKTVTIPVTSLQRYTSHLKPMWSNGLVCPANATDVSRCLFEEPLGFSDCSSGHILAVDCGSTVVQREQHMTAIRVGILVTVFVFVLALLIFLKIMCNLFRKRRDVVAVNNLSFPLPPADNQVNGSYNDDDETKLTGGSDDKAGEKV